MKHFIACCKLQLFSYKKPKGNSTEWWNSKPTWSKVDSDIFEWNRDWIEFDQMGSQTATEIVALMQKQFTRWENPDEIVTDSGKNYNSAKFSQFCQRKKIEHTKSSPHHHQSNGKSESAVKIAKSLLRKSPKTAFNPYEALVDQRNIPTVGMTTSPTQRFLNRRTRT